MLLISRLVLAAVFIVASLGKLRSTTQTARALVAFGVPPRLSRFGAPALPGVELAVATCLLVRSTAWWGALAAVLLLSVFSGAIAANLWRGRRPACSCFGQMRLAPVNGWTLLRNTAFAVPALVVVTSVHSNVSDSPGVGCTERSCDCSA